MDEVIASLVAVGVAAGPIAVGVTKIVDFLRGLFDPDGSRTATRGWVWIVVAMVVALATCVGWEFNVIATLIDSVPALSDSGALDGIAGQIITGVLVGGMASFWHERMDLNSSRAKAARAEALMSGANTRIR